MTVQQNDHILVCSDKIGSAKSYIMFVDAAPFKSLNKFQQPLAGDQKIVVDNKNVFLFDHFQFVQNLVDIPDAIIAYLRTETKFALIRTTE